MKKLLTVALLSSSLSSFAFAGEEIQIATHYEIQLCNENCGDGVKGIVGTVLNGEVEMTNDGGTNEFGTDQFFNVPSSNDAPRTMTKPPATPAATTTAIGLGAAAVLSVFADAGGTSTATHH